MITEVIAAGFSPSSTMLGFAAEKQNKVILS